MHKEKEVSILDALLSLSSFCSGSAIWMDKGRSCSREESPVTPTPP